MNGVKPGALHRSCSERRPQDARFCAPAFDVTPARYIAGIITERGVIQPVNEETVRAVVG